MAVLQIIPEIEIDLESLSKLHKARHPLDLSLPEKTDVVFIKRQESPFTEEIKDAVTEGLDSLMIKTTQKRVRAFVAPAAIPEIVFTVLTIGVLPVVLGVLSNCIYDRLKRKKDERLSIQILLKERELQFSASGSLQGVLNAINGLRKQVCANSYMSGNSHVASVIFGSNGEPIISDLTAPNGFDVKFDYYQRNYPGNSRLNLKMRNEVLIALACVGKAVDLANKGAYESAISEFNKALAIDEYCVEALYNLSLIYSKLGEDEKSLSYFEKAVGILNMLPKLKDQRPEANVNVLIKKLYPGR